eukprot:2554301-Pyramimonas_sp.AAC.1
MLHALEGVASARQGDKAAQRGTVAALGRAEELDVYLARGCGQLTVEVCDEVLGCELFYALRRT